jgi:hypothetical protein
MSRRRRHLFDLRLIDHDVLLVSNIATLTPDIPFTLFQRKARPRPRNQPVIMVHEWHAGSEKLTQLC